MLTHQINVLLISDMSIHNNVLQFPDKHFNRLTAGNAADGNIEGVFRSHDLFLQLTI